MNIKHFQNNLTVDGGGNLVSKIFIKWPVGNKSFLINKDGFTFQMLCYTFSMKPNKFAKTLSIFDYWMFQGYQAWYVDFLQQCCTHWIWVPSFHMYDPKCADVWGFICGDGSDTHLPSSYQNFLENWSTLIYQAMNLDGLFLEDRKVILAQSNQDGYGFLKQLVQTFHPYMVKNIANWWKITSRSWYAYLYLMISV